MRRRRAGIIFFLLIVALSTPFLAAQEAEEGDYSGVWAARFGPVTLEWVLAQDSYEFYAYQDRSIRIASRGTLSVDEGIVTFVSEETSEDGESWSELELPEEERSSSFALLFADEAIRLAQADRLQFFVEYRSAEEPLKDQEPPAEEPGPGTEGNDQEAQDG